MGGNARPVLVRWDDGLDEVQIQCGDCARAGRKSYWPGTREFWVPRLGFQRCRACHNTRRRLARRAAMDANAKQRAYYREHREHRLDWVRQYREANRERINALRRARYAARKSEAAAQAPGQEGMFE